MAEFLVRGYSPATRRATSWSIVGLLCASMLATVFGGVFSVDERPAGATALNLEFESVVNQKVTLGGLASRSQCKAMTRQGSGTSYTMTGTDSRTQTQYSFATDVGYSGAQLNESRESPNGGQFTHTPNDSYLNRNGVLRLAITTGTVAGTSPCNGLSVNSSLFGPEVYTKPFYATAGQALSFNWAAATVSGGDDYEIYAFLVGVNGNTSDRGSAATTTLLAHGRGKAQAWTTSTGSIPADGWYRFRFVNGSYDASGGTILGAAMYIDSNVLV